MEKYGPGFLGERELCMPGVSDNGRVVRFSDLACMAKKLAALGLLDQNYSSMATAKEQCIPPPPPLRRSPTPPTVDLSSPLQGFRSETGMMERTVGFSGGGCGRTLVGRFDGVEQYPGRARVGAYERGRSLQFRSQSVAKRRPFASQGGCCGPRLAYLPRQQIPNHYPVLPTKLVGSQRRCAGTGVFLPRVLSYNDNSSRGLSIGGSDVRRLKSERQQMVLSADTMTVDDKKKGTSYHPHISPAVELLLPQDWTY